MSPRSLTDTWSDEDDDLDDDDDDDGMLSHILLISFGLAALFSL